MTILESREAAFPRFRMVKYVKKVKLEFNFENIDESKSLSENILPYKEKIDKIYGQLTVFSLRKYQKTDYYMVIVDNGELNVPIVIRKL